jgi:hypothetical protein
VRGDARIWLISTLHLRYVGYPTFSGAATNYSGIERNTFDNDMLYLLV